MRNSVLHRQNFREYLQANADFVVGNARVASRCPLSTYLTDKTGELWEVNPFACVRTATDINSDERSFRSPAWAKRFIVALDTHFSARRDVLGSEALYVLDEVK